MASKVILAIILLVLIGGVVWVFKKIVWTESGELTPEDEWEIREKGDAYIYEKYRNRIKEYPQMMDNVGWIWVARYEEKHGGIKDDTKQHIQNLDHH